MAQSVNIWGRSASLVVVLGGCPGGDRATDTHASSTSSDSSTSVAETDTPTGTTGTSVATTVGETAETSGETEAPATTGEVLTKELTVIAEGYARSRPLILHDQAVIWGSFGDQMTGSGRVLRVAQAGGAVETLVEGLDSPTDLAALEDSVFWVDYVSGTVAMVQLDNLAVSVIATGYEKAISVGVDVDFLYWISAGTDRRFARWSHKGGQATDVATGLDNAPSLRVLPDSVIWVENGATNEVRSWSKRGGMIVTLGESGEIPRRLASDGDDVYWASVGAKSVFKIPVAGGPVVTVAAGLIAPNGVAVDNDRVYWTSTFEGTISYIDKSLDGPTTVLASGMTRPEELALSETHVYVTDFDAGQILRVGKPD